MARLDRLCLQDDDDDEDEDDRLWDKNGYKHRTKFFELVIGINHNLL